jgi:hypothetical protein
MSSAKISRTFGFSVAIVYPVRADPLLHGVDRICGRSGPSSVASSHGVDPPTP